MNMYLGTHSQKLQYLGQLIKEKLALEERVSITETNMPSSMATKLIIRAGSQEARLTINLDRQNDMDVILEKVMKAMKERKD